MINIKENKGITIITLILAIVIMLIISSIILYNAKTGIGTRHLNNMYNDIRVLKDRVDIYYSKYGKIPTIGQAYTNIPSEISKINPNDNNNYYVIDLESLENLTLNFGRGYKAYKNEQKEDENDIYIINEQSHNIYYVKGTVLDEKTYYTVPGEYNKIDIPSVNNISIKGINKNIATLEINASNKNDSVQAIKVYMNDNLYKTYSYSDQNKQTVVEILDVMLPFYNNTTFYIQAINESGEESSSDKVILKNEEVIATVDDMKNFANAVNGGETFNNKTIKLISDINLDCNEENQWVPIGTLSAPFAGLFDGNNHTVSGMYIQGAQNVGLFGMISKNGEIKNLNMNNFTIKGSLSGGLAAYNEGTIKRCIIENIQVEGNLNAGLIAVNNGNIEECAIKSCNLNGEAVGGIVMFNGTLRDDLNLTYNSGIGYVRKCYVTGHIGNNQIGAIVSHNGVYGGEGYIYDCYALAKVDDSTYNGSLAAVQSFQGKGGYIYNSYYANSETTLTSVAHPEYYGNVTNCYHNQEVTASVLNTNEEIWVDDNENINNGYPLLKWQTE